MIEVTELMIGDLVYNKHHRKNIRLTQYDFFTHTHNEFGEQRLAPYATPTIGRDLEPIPLEKIHLTKNGFEAREETDDTEFYYYDCYEINVSFDEGLPADNIPPIIFLPIEFAEKGITMPIEYVHELQQAMRIMGCDKEIEL
jgi:hypothetical protein